MRSTALRWPPLIMAHARICTDAGLAGFLPGGPRDCGSGSIRDQQDYRHDQRRADRHRHGQPDEPSDEGILGQEAHDQRKRGTTEPQTMRGNIAATVVPVDGGGKPGPLPDVRRGRGDGRAGAGDRWRSHDHRTTRATTPSRTACTSGASAASPPRPACQSSSRPGTPSFCPARAGDLAQRQDRRRETGAFQRGAGQDGTDRHLIVTPDQPSDDRAAAIGGHDAQPGTYAPPGATTGPGQPFPGE